MKILIILISSINKYGIKFLFFVILYEFFNIYRLRFGDYIVLNPIKKKNEPSVPTPYYCLKLIKNFLFKKKYVFIDFGCGKGRVINFIKKFNSIKKIIGIESNVALKENLIKLNDSKTKIYIKDCSNKTFISVLTKKYCNDRLILYFFHPFSQKILNKIIINFLNKNKKKLMIVIMGEIYINKKIKKKFDLKTVRIHEFLNIYNYKHH